MLSGQGSSGHGNLFLEPSDQPLGHWPCLRRSFGRRRWLGTCPRSLFLSSGVKIQQLLYGLGCLLSLLFWWPRLGWFRFLVTLGRTYLGAAAGSSNNTP